MSQFPELDAARRERNTEPIGFRVRGQDFHCVPVLGAGVVLELVGEDDDDDYLVMALTRFLRRVIVAEDWDRFHALLVAQHDPIDAEELTDIAGHLCDVYAGRPTERLSTSGGGPRSTGESSTDGSSSPAVVAV